MKATDCLIIGSGPAGYTAAIYAARANMHPILYCGLEVGGQLTTAPEVENFPGYVDGISGFELMEDLKKQAERFGVDIRYGVVTGVDFSKSPHKVIIDNEEVLESTTVIIATGANARYLGIDAEKRFAGRGVSACATCDGFFYRKKDVAVVGGGDSALAEALYLSALCNKVYLIVRRNVFRASKIMQERVLNTQNIEILWEHQPIDLIGTDKVEGAILIKKKGSTEEERVEIAISGFFLAVGHKPNTDFLGGAVDLDSEGYIITQPGTSLTNVSGVFAAGDVRNNGYKQAVVAAASGCIAALDAEHFINNSK